MTNIVLIAKDRPRLTQQTVDTLYANTPLDQFTLLCVDDGSEVPIVIDKPNAVVVRVTPSKGIVGFVRNLGAEASTQYFGKSDFLYFSDNDVAFFPNWLENMEWSLRKATEENLRLLGGYQHPFHGTNGVLCCHNLYRVNLVDAVAGYSMLMRWQTWDFGPPFDAHAKGVCQSEDFAFCQRLKERGYAVGYIDPPVIANCGLTNSLGHPAIGAEQFKRYPGLVYE